MPNLLRIKLAGVRTGFFFFSSPWIILWKKELKQQLDGTSKTAHWCFILMSWWILCSLKVMNWLAQRLKASDSPQIRNSKSQGNVSSFLSVPASLRNYSLDDFQNSSTHEPFGDISWLIDTGPKGLLKNHHSNKFEFTAVWSPKFHVATGAVGVLSWVSGRRWKRDTG